MTSLTVFYSMLMKRHGADVYCVGAFGRFLDELAQRADRVYLCAPVEETDELPHEYRIKATNVVVQPLPPFRSIVGASRHALKCHLLLRRYSRDWERVYIRYPSPYAAVVYRLAKRCGKPVFLHLVGDTRQVVEEGTKYEGLLRRVAGLYLDWAEHTLRRMVSGANFTFANGQGMRRLYSHASEKVREIRTSTFRAMDITERPDTCGAPDVTLLNVGFLRHEKGLEYLIRALPLVQAGCGRRVRLDLVGQGDAEAELRALARDRGCEAQVHFRGYVPMGPALSALYQGADIFVLPSVSEGTPRVLLEAMANGLPVVATAVGGVPFTVQDSVNGLLVAPKSPDELAKAICQVISEDQLRRRLIDGGYQTARTNTLEHHVGELVAVFEQACGEVGR